MTGYSFYCAGEWRRIQTLQHTLCIECGHHVLEHRVMQTGPDTTTPEDGEMVERSRSRHQSPTKKKETQTQPTQG